MFPPSLYDFRLERHTTYILQCDARRDSFQYFAIDLFSINLHVARSTWFYALSYLFLDLL